MTLRRRDRARINGSANKSSEWVHYNSEDLFHGLLRTVETPIIFDTATDAAEKTAGNTEPPMNIDERRSELRTYLRLSASVLSYKVV